MAQQTESRITGRVLDQSQAALPGVTVTVTAKATAAVRTAVTDGEGNCAITNLGPGASAQPHGRARHGASDADFTALHLLRDDGRPEELWPVSFPFSHSYVLPAS